jgi:hypothetical protein
LEKKMEHSDEKKAAVSLATFERMLAAYHAMTESEREALHKWEQANLGDGLTATSDWPGWRKAISRLSH